MSTQKVNDGLSSSGGANPSKRIISKLFWGVVLVLGLVLAAFYAPLLQKSSIVNAIEPRAATYIAPANAPVLEVDSTLLVNQTALAALYEQVAPSVVNIQVIMGGARNDLPERSLPESAPPQQGVGSGFIYDNNGYIVTNNHVVDGGDQITVVFNGGRWADAEVVATDPQADLAVLKVTPPSNMEWRPLPLAGPDTLRVGYTVIAIGNPFGLEGTMTTGIISALGRGMPVGGLGESRYTLPDIIQTDAAINPGNSGGPLLNLAGEVVGINFAIESPARVNSGVGFAIPVSIIRRVVPALIANGKFTYAYLGLSGRAIDGPLAAALALPTDRLGVYVAEVVPDGPAAKAGIRAGQPNSKGQIMAGSDIITAIADKPVRRFEDLVSYLVTQSEPGKTVALTLLRDGKELKVDVTLGERPDQALAEQAQMAKGISARQAVGIALDAVRGALNGPITETVVTPEQRSEQEVWVVELSTATQSATVIIDRASGEILAKTVE